MLTNGKINEEGGLSKNTVYDICNILKQVFKANNIDINIIKVNKNIGKEKSLYPNERKKLINLLKADNSPISLGVLLSLFLGLRESEVCGIK